jgi:hypothetical protein
MANFFLAVLVIGFALTAVSFLTGVAGHSFDQVSSIGHAGHVGHGAGPGNSSGNQWVGLRFLNFGTVTSFMMWFGGIGFLAATYSKLVVLLTVIVALAGGLVGAGLIFFFMVRVLGRDQIPLDPADYYLPGTLGHVTVTIPQHGTGEVLYSQAGTRKTVAARAADAVAIPRGTEVVVLNYERGFAYVRRWDQVSGEQLARTKG